MARNIKVKRTEETATISGVCTASGSVYSVEVPSSQYDRWRHGMLIQRAMPQLSDDQREFLISGTTPHEWDNIFSGQEE